MPFQVQSPWYTAKVDITTYSLVELLGSKIRALYQRSKGRDLFDLWYAITNAHPSAQKTVECFLSIMHASGLQIRRQDFLNNMTRKMADADFRNDMSGLLRPGIEYDIDAAWELVARKLINILP
jgi:predicted nucleotidyltransferase component of viral defense system